VSFQQQNSTIQVNLFNFKEFEERRKDICFQLALINKGGLYTEVSQINKVNKEYQRLLHKHTSEKALYELEKRLFENV
jgi:hypothetical protein